jgi:phosphoribosylformylglycinamidine synthase subunit PurQ / glutaminase
MADVGLLMFPGSNCDQDCLTVFHKHFKIELAPIWHRDRTLPKVSGIVIPGGFSYGDYLRSGGLASHSPVMVEVAAFAKRGGAILGICNGFQILTEAHILPGALLANAGQDFVCQYVDLITDLSETSVYHKALNPKKTHLARLSMPIAHGEGRYYVDNQQAKSLKDNGQVLFRYGSKNPNGSTDDIAGIIDPTGKIMGMMPHPERATEGILGSTDGLLILEAFLATFL